MCFITFHEHFFLRKKDNKAKQKYSSGELSIRRKKWSMLYILCAWKNRPGRWGTLSVTVVGQQLSFLCGCQLNLHLSPSPVPWSLSAAQWSCFDISFCLCFSISFFYAPISVFPLVEHWKDLRRKYNFSKLMNMAPESSQWSGQFYLSGVTEPQTLLL